jgi:hypothetical protein
MDRGRLVSALESANVVVIAAEHVGRPREQLVNDLAGE